MKCAPALLAAAFMLCGTARADDPSQAETLFLEGKDLIVEGRVDEACKKFAASMRVEASVGAAGNLAACRERQGRLASALSAWRQTVRLAEAAGDTARAATGRQMAARLVPIVPKLSIEREASNAALPPGTEVRVNDAVLAIRLLGEARPLDPGKYHVEVSAPGYRSWTADVLLEAADRRRVAIPPLHKRSPATQPKPDEPIGELRAAGITTTAVGAAALVAGALIGTIVLVRADTEADSCDAELRCDVEVLARIDELGSLADASTGLLVVGGATATVGITLLGVDAARRQEGADIALSVIGTF